MFSKATTLQTNEASHWNPIGQPTKKKPGNQPIDDIYKYFLKIIEAMKSQDTLLYRMGEQYKKSPEYSNYSAATTACHRLCEEYQIAKLKTEITQFSDEQIAYVSFKLPELEI